MLDEGAQVAANIQAARRVLAADDYSFNMPGSAFLAIRALITSTSPLAHAWCSGVSPSGSARLSPQVALELHGKDRGGRKVQLRHKAIQKVAGLQKCFGQVDNIPSVRDSKVGRECGGAGGGGGGGRGRQVAV